ncbi:MAG TPA: endolytic transglycosylase MltG [Steroidobacteraceae bacterium]|nr:endolytic transglycosylase MltG [Steroidobacteraceae bacterium]
MKRLLPAVAILALVAIAAWLGWHQYERHWLQSPIAGLTAPAVFEVPKGASLRAVANELHDQGWLDRPSIWLRHANRAGLATRIKAGEYRVLPGTSPAALLDQFVAGDVVLHALTIPEGWTFRQALVLIQANPMVKAELKDLPEAALLARLGLKARSAEGLFFPDTYRFPRGTSDRTLLLQAHERLERELAAAWARRAADLLLATPYDVLILASLVEKETAAADERPLIAGVFLNRLRKGMRLQTDPSVIYGIGEKFDGNLRRRDLRTDTPYNTYTRIGLPPTPIALVGREALEAAVNPAKTDALYFVATGLGDGRHYFADTLIAHNRNVSRHLSNLRRSAGVRVR